jgi:ATP-dependent Clp protease ATP-binding subunit ClpA
MILSKNLQDVLYQAILFAINQLNHQYLTPEHVLFCALDDKSMNDLFTSQNVDLKQLRNQLYHHLQHRLEDLSSKNTDRSYSLKFTNHLTNLLERAIVHSYDSRRLTINLYDFVIEMMTDNESFGGFFLKNLNLDVMDVIKHSQFSRDAEEQKNPTKRQFFTSGPQTDGLYDFLTSDSFDSKEKKNGFLSQFCTNFNQKAAMNKIDPVFAREKELKIIIQSLCCRRKGNGLLVGDSGVGKTAIIEYLAQKIVNSDSDIPKKFKNAIVYSLDLNGLISGTRYRGDLEERLKNLMNEIESSKQPIILFIDEIHTVIGTGSTNNGTLDIGNILKPYLARGMIYCIGATTRKEFTQFLSKDKAFLRRFQIIYIDEPSQEDAQKMIKGIIKHYENYHNVFYSDNAIQAAIKLSKRYIAERQLPDVALDVIDFAGSTMNIERECNQSKNSTISKKEIENVISSITGIPSLKISGAEAKKVLNLENDLKKIIIGQDEAIRTVCTSILVNKSGLSNSEDKNKPIASYIFYGPTGVGKTEMAIQLANLMNMNMIRIDMSEYSEGHSVSKLFGSPPGYVGFEQSGVLTEQVHKHPYSVILFDEIEKSHHAIHNTLLQILDYGKMTDNFGRNINFLNTIIICTTNTGSSSMDKITAGFGNANNNDIVDKELEEIFSPEFRNRFSAIIRFNHLSEDAVFKIIDKEMDIIRSLFKKKKIDFLIEDSVNNFILKNGYNKSMGARPIERFINEKIKIKLANLFLEKEISKSHNDEKIVIDVKGNEIVVD